MGEYLIPEKEFINTLSENAISVAKLFDYVKAKKECQIYLSNKLNAPAYTDNQTTRYLICLNKNILQNDFEYAFLHEYIHCKQIDLDFPFLRPREVTEENQNICNNLNTYVLDFHVDNILKSFGYSIDIYKQFNQFMMIMKIAISEKDITNISSGIIHYSQKLAMFTSNGFDVSIVINQLKNIRPEIVKTYDVLIKAHKMYDCHDRKSVYKMFKYITNNLNIHHLVY